MDIRVDIGRIRKDVEALAEFGRDPKGGISRPSFSRADLEARAWLKDRFAEACLACREDGAGNIFGRLEGPGKTVLAGSHIDTVLNGGMYDGSVGVLTALECLRRIKEEKLALTRALEVVSFTDEEGNLVGDFLGSRAFLGLLNGDALRRERTQFGRPLAEVLDGTGFTVEGILTAHAGRPELEAYLELHIEQGPVLDDEGIPVGVVEAIAGKRYLLGSFIGAASHAGTTPLELRRDAFLGLADMAIRSTQHVATHHYGAMVTVGKVAVHPGSFSIVPGRVEFSLDYRSSSPEVLRDLDRELAGIAEEVASARGLTFAAKIMDATEPVLVPERLLGILEGECGRLGVPFLRVRSGAGHDAQILASVCDAGMVFIPSPDGASHSSEESVRWDDLEKGANVLLGALVKLAT
jgi:N-carbamoyl-L-amino-acid hydrolase